MTALCGGGPSQQKPGTPDLVDLSSNALAVFIEPFIGGDLAELLAPIIQASFRIDVATYCATDPPPDPGLTPADVIDAIAVPPSGTSFASQRKIVDWFGHRYWWQICECTSAATPAPPTPSNPNVGPISNPGLPDAGATQPCWTVQSAFVSVAQNAGQTGPVQDLTSQFLPSMGPTHSVTTGTTHPTTLIAQTIPPGVSHLHMDVTGLQLDGGGNEYFTEVDFFNAAGTGTGSISCMIATSGSSQPTADLVAIPANSVYWAAYAWTTFAAFTETVNFSFYCPNTGPNGLQTPCCPPDPLIENTLNLILQAVLAITTTSAPTSWSDGVRHAGLATNGSFTLSNPKAIGVRVEVTTLPVPPLTLPGTPTFYWDMGFITPIALTSPLRGWRLVFQKQSFQLPAFTDSIGYTLLHGTVADIVELLPVTA